MSQPRRTISRSGSVSQPPPPPQQIPDVPPVGSQEQQSTPTPAVTTTKTLKSSIFVKHFKKEPIEGNDTHVWASCNYCESKFMWKKNGGYGTLQKHLKSFHPVEWGLDQQQQQLQGGSSSNATDLFHFNHNEWRDGLAKIISVQHLPFNFGDNPIVTNIIQKTLQPAAKRIPRNTLKRAVIKLFLNQKNYLKNYFDKSKSNFSICCDIWSDHWQTHSYMGVTCHWIDENYFIQKRLLAYRVFDEQHNATNIARTLKIIFQEYCLENKIFSISFDNAQSNTASIPELERSCRPCCGGKFFHIRCIAHVLNLCVQDGLKDMGHHLTPIRNAINLIWTYGSIRKEWRKFCKINGKRPKAFPRDVPTRWNSTYRLLNDCFEYKELLSTFLLNNYRPHYFEPDVWDNLFQILNLLATFNFATERLSGVYYATSHLVVTECLNIAYVLKEMHEKFDFCLTSINMKFKLCKYFLDIPMLNLVATFLDPRVRLDGLEEYLNSYYSYLRFDNINLNDEIFSHVVDNIIEITNQINLKNVDNILLQTRNVILELLGEMSISSGSGGASGSGGGGGEGSGSGGASGSGSGTGGAVFGRGRSDFIMQERIMKKPKSTYNSLVEMEVYLSLETDRNLYSDPDFDVLRWWRENALQLPTLSVIARAIFGCPVSTVAVEQAFSSGGNTLTETRSLLHPSSLEAQVCLDDWTKAEQRCQGQAHLADYDQFDLSSDDTATGDSDTDAQHSAVINQQ